MNSRKPGLRVLHVLRAPVGGLFRHVMDLAREQAARGHEVGIVADSTTGGDNAARKFTQIAPSMRLGVARFPMRREPHADDIAALARVCREIARTRPDVIHGHGSKGGFYARATGFLPFFNDAVRVYTPHGGSFHFQPGHKLYMTVEKFVARRTDILLFESQYIAGEYAKGVGATQALQRVARNGLRPEEFTPVPPAPGAAEFVYIGELSTYKGVDTLIRALAEIHADGKLSPRLAIVGSGCERDKLSALVEQCGLARHAVFHGVLPAREAFALGQVLVVPSRAESLPYIVMEAIAADKSVVATDVGGIGEIFGPLRDRLICRDDSHALARALVGALLRDPAEAAAERAALSEHVAKHFNVNAMTDAVLSAYAQALARREAAPAIRPGVAL